MKTNRRRPSDLDAAQKLATRWSASPDPLRQAVAAVLEYAVTNADPESLWKERTSKRAERHTEKSLVFARIAEKYVDGAAKSIPDAARLVVGHRDPDDHRAAGVADDFRNSESGAAALKMASRGYRMLTPANRTAIKRESLAAQEALERICELRSLIKHLAKIYRQTRADEHRHRIATEALWQEALATETDKP